MVRIVFASCSMLKIYLCRGTNAVGVEYVDTVRRCKKDNQGTTQKSHSLRLPVSLSFSALERYDSSKFDKQPICAYL